MPLVQGVIPLDPPRRGSVGTICELAVQLH